MLSIKCLRSPLPSRTASSSSLESLTLSLALVLPVLDQRPRPRQPADEPRFTGEYDADATLKRDALRI